MKRTWKRTLSVVLSIAMLFGMTGMNTALAVEGTPPGTSGLCEHHPEHDADCGYTEGTPEIRCSYEHTDECYEEVTNCVHNHSEQCYDDSEEIATGSEAREPVNCTHVCDETSGCVTEVLDCQQHNDECGYIAAVPGTPCAYVCEECAEKDSGEQTPPPANDGLVQTVTGFPSFDPESFRPLDVIEVEEKSTVEAIGLPGTVTAAVEDLGDTQEIPVTWETADGSDYETTEAETYDFNAVLGEGYQLADGLDESALPYITVNITGAKNPNAKDGITSAEDLKAALESTAPSTITLGATITLDENVTMNASHTLDIPADYTLTTNAPTGSGPLINIGAKELTVTGGGTVVSKGNTRAFYGKPSDGGTLNLKNITVNLQGNYSSGISVPTVNVEDGATINLVSAYGTDLIYLNNASYTLNVKNGGKINIQKFRVAGLTVLGTVNIESGGEITVGPGSNENRGIAMGTTGVLNLEDGGTLTGTSGGAVYLWEGNKVTGMSGKLKDRGTVLTEEGEVTVDAAETEASASGLSAGLYIWDGTRFAKDDNTPRTFVTAHFELESALMRTTNSTIIVSEDIDITDTETFNITMRADHTLEIPEGKTVSASNGFISIGAHTLNIQGGGTFQCSRTDGNGLYANPGTLNLQDITVEITSPDGGISATTLNINNGAEVNLKSAAGSQMIRINEGGVMTVNNGGSVNILDFAGNGIYNGGTLHINGGAVTVGAGGDTNMGIVNQNGAILKITGGTLTGNTGGAVYLAANSTVEGLNGKFKDQGVPFATADQVMVGESAALPSADKLSAGLYVWDGSVFAKAGSETQTHIITVINGSASPTAAEAGATVTLTADAAPSGRRFKEWTTGDGVIFADATSSSTTFIMPDKAVMVTATYENLPAEEYSITVQNNGHGTANANVNSAAQGTEITLTASPASGYRFKEWQVVSGTAIIENNQFTMPAGNMVIKAVFEENPVVTYTVAFDLAGGTRTGGGELQQTVSSGGAAAAPTVIRSGYTFNGWDKDFSNVTANLNVTARWNETGNSGGDSSSGDSSSSDQDYTTTMRPTEKDPAPQVVAQTSVEAKTGADGSAAVSVPEKNVTDAIKAAQDAAKKAGTEKNGIAVVVDVKTDKAASSLSTTLPVGAVEALIQAGVTNIKIQSSAVNIMLDLAALKAAQAAAGGAITVTVQMQNVSGLSAAAQKAIGNRPVLRFTLASGGKPVTDFGGGTASLAIPYTSQAGEDTGKLCVIYVDDKGGVTYLTDSSYDLDTKAMLVRTGHFSVYGVGYQTDAPQFTDTANHWAKDDIDFVAARGLFSSTGNDQFSPDTGMTRGMFVTALGRLAGIDKDAWKNTKFTDVAADTYYAPYITWAADKGMVKGINDTTFAPDQAITRQDMAVIMANYAKVCGYTVPKTRAAITFADKANIAGWAAEAVRSMQMAGVLMGKNDNRFDPTASATRAEAAAVLHRYVELVIDPATAQGWTKNDAGAWLYYENGKPVTGWKLVTCKWYYLDTAGLMQSGGWKQIGGKWYYLYADGSMAVDSKIDGYEIGPDGARKES